MVVYFHRIGFSGVSANTIVVPLMCAVIPVGFIAIFTGWAWVAKAAGWLLAASHAVVDWHVHLEPNWRIPDAAIVAGDRHWRGADPGGAGCARAGRCVVRRRPPARWQCCSLLLLWHPFAPEIARNELEMTVVDVGQGDSILLTFPDGKLMLVDGGGIPTFGRHAPSQMDIGEDVVSPYLWDRSIGHIDVMVVYPRACRPHRRAAVAARKLPRQGAVDRREFRESGVGRLTRHSARDDGVRIVPLHRGQHFHYGGAELEVLAPRLDYVPKEAPHNNDSLAFRVTFGRHSFLLSGDIERQIEAELVAEGLVRKTDVLKVPHHGSKTSSTAAFLDLLHPAFAVMSAGFENSYGHPHAEVIARYEERQACVLRTDLDGLVTVRSDGRRLAMDMGRWSGALGSASGALLPREF